MYRNPGALPERVKVIQLLTRPASAMQAQAEALIPSLRESLAGCGLSIDAQPVKSQIGSGSLPVERLPSVALAISAVNRTHEKKVVRLERILRGSDIAVIGRLSEKTLLLDLRCLTEDKESTLRETILAAVQRLGTNK
jgi:L-seryl-tRNA(Ser) seleniumtransferase